MAKYIYFQDAHCKGINPVKRTDNYYNSWLKKFKEVLSLAKKNKAVGIIDGGDLLDIPVISNNIVDDILDLIESSKIPFYTMFGNHGMIGHHRETSNSSSMAHMVRRCKIMKETSEIQDDHAVIRLYEYNHEIEQSLKDNGIQINSDLWKIAIVHAFVTPKPFVENVLHVVADQIVSNADLVLVAHYHTPWEKQVKDTTYLDIGCFGRTKISEAEIEPSVLLLDTKKQSYEVIKLKSASAGNEVFDLSKKEHQFETEKDLELFIANLKDFKSQSLDIVGTIKQIGKEQSVDKEIINLIIKKLGKMEEGE